jgi:folate-binding protein YgfZ
MKNRTITPGSASACDPALLREGAALVALDDVSFVEFAGEDRRMWLQGQITNDLTLLPPFGAMDFCLCSPTGQLQGIGRLWDLEDRYLVAIDQASLPALMERCEQMIVIEAVQAKIIEGALRVSVQGPRATEYLERVLSLPRLDAGTTQLGEFPAVILRSNRTGLGGWDLLLFGANEVPAPVAMLPVAPEEAVQCARLEAGIPRFGVDTDAKTLPPELGPAFESQTVSYSKGCYVGQEVLMRIHSRGHTNRLWMGLLCASPVERGARVSHRSRPEAGLITSACVSRDFGPIAAAYVRREIAIEGEQVEVMSESGSVPAELRRFPLTTTE